METRSERAVEVDADPSTPRRGRFKVYLGGAPGSGKTFAMLTDANRLREQGVDVVAGFIETYQRPRTIQAIGQLEVLPRLQVSYRGTVQEEMDLDGLLHRHPRVALVDELAHTNVPGLRNQKRWQDVEMLLDAGIDVLATVNIQHIAGVKDLVERITGITVRETIPDRLLDEADDLQFIDITPEALRKRMRHGNIYPSERVEPALDNFFNETNLTALREIGLRLVADSMAERSGVLQTGEDVLVLLLGEDLDGRLVRRGARLARRLRGLAMVAAIVDCEDGDEKWTEEAVQVSEQVGSACTVLRTTDVAREAINTVTRVGARVVIVDSRAREIASTKIGRSLAMQLVDALPDVDLLLAASRAGREPVGIATDLPERPHADDVLRKLDGARRRASFRIHLGYAAGVGATTHMLDEARRRRSRGTDVVVGAVRSRKGPPLACEGLELVGGPGGAAAHDRLDVDAVLARNPDVVCIDDLVGSDTQGKPRVDSVKRFLRSGITVLATLHLLDVHSIRDAYQGLVSPRHGPAVEDVVLVRADEIELVDLLPEDLVARLRQGQVLPPSMVARALQGEFRLDVLGQLRESALRLLAEHTDARLVHFARHQAPGSVEARSRIVLCVQPEPNLESRLRRVAEMAERQDAKLTVLSVRPPGLDEPGRALLGDYAALTHRLGGEFVTRHGVRPADAIIDYVESTATNEVVVGRPSRRRLPPWDVVAQLSRRLPEVTLNVQRREPAQT